MAFGTGFGSLHVLASHRASDVTEREGEIQRHQDGHASAFYNLISEVTYHHFWCIPRVTQTGLVHVGGDCTKVWLSGCGVIGGPLEAGYPKGTTRYATSMVYISSQNLETKYLLNTNNCQGWVLILSWHFSYFIRKLSWCGFEFLEEEFSPRVKMNPFLAVSLFSLHWQHVF